MSITNFELFLIQPSQMLQLFFLKYSKKKTPFTYTVFFFQSIKSNNVELGKQMSTIYDKTEKN